MSSETSNGGTQKPPIPPPAKKDPALNIGLRGDRLYEINSLNKWFAISSLLLFVFTVWMIWFDYNREWKRYQREFTRLSIQRTQQDMQTVAFDQARYEELVAQLAQAEAELVENQDAIDQIEGELNVLDADFYAADQNFRFARATYDVDKFNVDEAVANAPENTGRIERLRAIAAATENEISTFELEVEELTLAIRDKQAELDTYIGRRDEIQSEIDESLNEFNQLQTTLDTLDPGFIVTSIRNAPVMDFMNPSEKINQLLLPDLHNEHPFLQIPRVDRCTSCHLGIDQAVWEGEQQPFAAHPELDLFLGSDSPHPMDQFGCTTCHAGRDRATEFSRAGHTPVDAAQREEWEAQYGWVEDHFLDTPMLPLNRVEASCLKCHTGAGDVPEAPELNQGRDLVRMYGCFGCHRIPGYEEVRRVGPDLTTIASKLDEDWVRKWLREPRAFKSEARMPQFWGNSNNLDLARDTAEINAITDFLFARSQPSPLPVAARTNGNAARGQEILENVGCLACHAVGPIPDDPARTQHRRRFGYNLSGQGSKVSLEWLYNWVRDPEAVWHDTNMPSLRLTDAESADVAAYLSSLTNPDFEALTVQETDEAKLDEIVLEFLQTTLTGIEARERAQAMSLEEKNMYAGERLVARYGCFGCHTIEGFENTQPIGTELTQAGSKLVGQLDFGFVDIEHERTAWYEQKLTDPRIFDVDRVRRPEELARMPNFHFTEEQVDALVLVLAGLVKDQVIPDMRNDLTAEIEAGRALIAQRNCRGCHDIEGAGGDVRSTIDDEGLWPPLLTTQGAKTQPFWLHSFLLEPGSVTLRPWLTARMPTFYFDQEEANTLARYFSAVDGVEYPFVETSIATTDRLLGEGDVLFGNLQCTQCHPTSDVLPAGREAADLAPNLGIAWERLRPQWVIDWVRNPQLLMPGTRMPEFYRGGESQFPEILENDVEAQLTAMRDHIFITLGDGQRAESTDD